MSRLLENASGSYVMFEDMRSTKATAAMTTAVAEAAVTAGVEGRRRARRKGISLC